MRILVTGADGQLGRSIRKLVSTVAADFVFATRTDLDIADEDAIRRYFTSQHFDFCINTAAYTNVDLAEQEDQLALTINAEAPGRLAQICDAQGCTFIHISSDYVYHNDLRRPLKEDDPLFPASVYARTKLEGEQNALKVNPHTIIIRTSWLFSEFGHNFVKTMARLMKEGKPLRIVNDQMGCPTYASDLAHAILKIIQLLWTHAHTGTYGIFNYCNAGAVTWFGFAQEIATILGVAVDITPVSSSEYSAPAQRPAYSVLDTSRIRDVFQVSIPHWREGLQYVLGMPGIHI